MQARFLRSLLLLLSLNLLIKPFWLLGIDRTVQNLVGNEVYGVYYALFSLSLYLQIILDPGIHTYNNKSIASDKAGYSSFLSELLPLKTSLSFIYLALTLTLAWLLGYGKLELSMLLWISLGQVFASMTLYFRSNLGGLLLFNTDSIFSVLDRLLMILICSVLIWGSWFEGAFKIEWFVYAQTVAFGLTTLAAGVVSFRRADFFMPQFKASAIRRVILQSYPFALLTVLMVLYSRLDILMLERLLHNGNTEAGIYAGGYRLLEAANMIAFLFATLLLPIFSNQVADKKISEARQTASVFFRLLYVPGLLLALASFFFKQEIAELLYRENVPAIAEVFGWLMFSFIGYTMIYVYGTFLTAAGDMKFLNFTAAGGLVLNFIINFMLIFRFGALGAVIATLITQSLVAVAHVLRSGKFLRYNILNGTFFKLVVYSVIAAVSFWAGKDITSSPLINLLALTVINLTFAAIMGLIKPRHILKIVRTKDKYEQ